MTVSFAHDAALLPLLGAFGEQVTLPDGSVITAIVDFYEGSDDAPFGRPILPDSWHFTMRATQAVGIANGQQLIHDHGRYRVRHCLPEGHGLTTLVTTLISRSLVTVGSLLLEGSMDLRALLVEGATGDASFLLEDA